MKIIDKVYEESYKDKMEGSKNYILVCIMYNTCPSDYGFKDVEDVECVNCYCQDCWNREIEEEE